MSSSPVEPRDPWDEIPSDPHRVGQHRAQPYQPAAGHRRYVAAGALALLLGLICGSVLPAIGFVPKASSGSQAASSASSVPSATATPKPSANGTANSALRKRTVAIYDATGESGKLTEAAAKVAGKGWVVGELGSWSGETPARTTIFYGKAGLKAAAELLAADLDGVEVKYDATVKDTLQLVLSPGYAAG